mmetsp:Transcript_22679/g.42175  ORF Transcript_22679/g.42175 Transcript_22679/m.42175 type:complete len:224 (+) Transcript_22679:368-1039(+)
MHSFMSNFEIHAFQKPEAFLFFVRLTTGKIDDEDNSRGDLSATSVVHWEGFVTAVEQGAWGDSTILFFHLKELADIIQWTPSIQELLNFSHRERDEDAQFQNTVKEAFSNFALTMVAIRKEEGHTDDRPLSSKVPSFSPNLVVASRGVHFVTQDNKIYYHVHSRRYSTHEASNAKNTCSEGGGTVGQSEIFPRLVTTESIPASNQPGVLLGIRLVCNQGVSSV